MDINSIWANFISNEFPDGYLDFIVGEGEGESFDLNDFNVKEINASRSIKYNCDQKVLKITFPENFETFGEGLSKISECFQTLHLQFIESLDKKDFVRLVFNHSAFNINTPFISKEDMSHVNIMSFFEYTLQSYKTLKINEDKSFYVYIISARLPRGGRKMKSLVKKQKIYVKKSKLNKKHFKNQQDMCNKSTGIINIFNSDNLCGLRAILIAIAFESKDLLRFKMCEKDSPILNSKVKEIVDKLHLNDEPMSPAEFKKIEDFFQDYQITIFNSDAKLDKSTIYKGSMAKKFIYISFTGSHYNVIRSMMQFFKRRYFCDYCKTAYSNINSHNCEYVCKMCKRQKCLPEFAVLQQCSFCTNKCFNAKCFKIHQNKICIKSRLCIHCKQIKTNKHVCGIYSKWCFNCRKSVNDDHKCFILRESDKINKKKKFNGYIFFDYEAGSTNGTHNPNLIVIKKICCKCLDSTPTHKCNDCENIKFFDNSKFCEWLFMQKHHVAIAHNLKGYDGVFIMNYILENFLSIDKLPNVCLNGTKIISISFRNVTIIDSYSFLPMSLDKFSETFSIADNEKKKFFPHKFNTPENQNYVGCYPSPQYYGSNYFSIEKKIEFDKWYDQVKLSKFDFRLEFESYCVRDVEILAKGCLAFRNIIRQITRLNDSDEGVDPFRVCSTLASLCHIIFRRNFMKKDSIAIIPSNGYVNQKNSNKAITWLKYVSEKDNLLIRHARNGGEFKLGKYSLDGHCKETNTVYEFHGCYYHGCPRCFENRNFWNASKQSSMKFIYNQHLNRIKYIKACNVNLVEMWECDWDKECKTNPNVKEFLKKNKKIERLNPRDALYGGRNNAFKLYYKCSFNQRIRYFDFNSLYPYVQKYKRFPVGHPEIITENFQNIEIYFGIIKCRVIPPRKLYVPVLPLKINKKLVYTLCFSCALGKNQHECKHTDEERCLEGTWVTYELHEALKYGYKIDLIYEIWHWNETECYNYETNSGGLFTECVNLFYKYKQEASGNANKCNYIEENYIKEGIMLDYENIKSNPGMRKIMKLLLNAFWGKYGMKVNKPRFKIIVNPNEWYEMLQNQSLYIIHSVDFSNERFIVVFYSFTNEQHVQSYEVNVVIAAFVTCHARLHLLNELVKLNERVLYFDTDSVIFVQNLDIQNEYLPSTGNYLGEFKDELGENSWIVEFVSAGCKNIAYLLNNGDSKCIIKGFALNHLTNLILNFESIKKIVTEDISNSIIVDQLKFSRNKYDWTVKSEEIKKTYSMVYDKRALFNGYHTLPFGF